VVSPGSLGTRQWSSDIAARSKAAFYCVVYRMRREGVLLPAAEVAAQIPPNGGIICMDLFTAPRWHAQLLTLPDLTKHLLYMYAVRLVRVSGGFRQYQAIEYSEKADRRWPQTWLCAPNEAAAIAVLDKMASTEPASSS
jgi:hypothetical protein